MIREIKHQKSLKDFWKDECGMCANDPNKDFSTQEYALILSVCPVCGQKQYIRWSLSGLLYHTSSDYDAVYSYDYGRSGSVTRLYKKLFEEIDDYLTNHFVCVSCSSELSFEPGLFLSSTRLCFGNLEDGGMGFQGVKPPYGYKYRVINHNQLSLCFDGYLHTTQYRNLAGLNNLDSLNNLELNDEGIYDYNPLSRAFILKMHVPSAKTGIVIRSFDNFHTREFDIENLFSLMDFYQQQPWFYKLRVDDLIQNEMRHLYEDLEVDSIKYELPMDKTVGVLRELINIDTTIMSLSSRLESVYKIKNQENYKYISNNSATHNNEDVSQFKKRIEELVSEREALESSPLDYSKYANKLMQDQPVIEYPSKPVAPTPPTYEEPGMFNKKKIEQLNAEKKRRYDEQLSYYNTLLAECERQVLEAQRKEEQQREDVKQEAIKMAEEERQERLKGIESLLSVYQSKIDSINNAKAQSDNKESSLVELPWNKEYDQALELLKKALEIKCIYDKSNVIYYKYRYLIAYTRFLEYFESGRCSSLSGPYGAYNLFEDELRNNIIIGKLDDISNSLEEIKNNQVLMYHELQSINNNISMLNNSMNRILDKVSEIGTNVEAIRNSTEIMEENTKIAAYYSKKNAELTNAMGYLVALK